MLNSIFNFEEHLIITFIASFLIWFMVAGVIYLWIYQKKIQFRQVLSVFAMMMFAWALSELLKKIFPVQRPFMVSGLDPLTLTFPFDSSFPSTHASTAFALATSFRKSDKKLFILYFIFAVVVAVGRVLSRVHYVVDVLVGAIIGILTVLILERMGFDKFFKRILS